MVARYLNETYVKKMFRQDFGTVFMLSLFMTIDGYKLYKATKGTRHAIAFVAGMMIAFIVGIGGPL
ncbi:MAG: hypothetical protein QW561_04610, partial [Candidatus Aenigmatarchaeota archaeon]